MRGLRLAPAPWLIALPAFVVACAHGAPSRPVAAEAILWPAPPQPPRARFLRGWTAATAQNTRSGLRRFIDAVAGIPPANDRGPVELRRPFGLAWSGPGALVVADPDAQAVFRLPSEGAIAPIECAGRAWVAPMAVTPAFGGDLVVADAGAGELVRISPGGACATLGREPFERPVALAAAGDRLYVVDSPRHLVLALSAAGEVIQRFGGRGPDDGQLNFPTAVAVAGNGEVLVVDALNFRVARFAGDGRWLGAFGEAGEDEGQLARPKGLAVAADGRVFVSDQQRDVILVFRADGSYAYELGAPGGAPGYLHGPAGVAVAGTRLAVADGLNGRVQEFELLGGST